MNSTNNEIGFRILCHAMLWLIVSSGRGISRTSLLEGEITIPIDKAINEAILLLNDRREELMEERCPQQPEFSFAYSSSRKSN